MTIFKHNTNKAKEIRQEQNPPSQQPRLFDAKLIGQCLFKIIPKDYPQTRIVDGVFTIDSYWKHGELKRIDIDQQNVTDVVDLLSVETAFENMLTNAKRFRRNFTGKLKLTVKLKNKEIESLYRDEGNFIINKATHYSNKQ